MLDVRATTLPDAATAPEAPPSPTHVAVRREDYSPPDWLVPELRLDFDLDPEATQVRATLEIVRNGSHDRPLRLDGEELEPASVSVDGKPAAYRMDGKQLVIEVAGERATVETQVTIHPAANTKLM